MAPREEEPRDHVQGEEVLPPPPWWHAPLLVFIISIAPMAVGGLAVNWWNVGRLDIRVGHVESRISGEVLSRITSVEDRIQFIEDTKLGDLRTGTQAREDWAAIDLELAAMRAELTKLRVIVAGALRVP